MRVKILGLALILPSLILAAQVAAQPGPPTSPGTQELIALLEPGVLKPDDVVNAINEDRPVPGGLGAEAVGQIRGRAVLGFIDEGIMTDHEDLRISHLVGGLPVFDGGSFRAHLSRDVASTSTDCSVDELDMTNPPGNIDLTPRHRRRGTIPRSIIG